MNVHISYKTAKAPDLEKQFNHQIEKLGRRLQVFRPELVHLKGIIEQSTSREGVVVSLNLRLPSGQMASQEAGPTGIAAMKAAFSDLVSQLTRHKDMLRSHQRRRLLRRSAREQSLPTVPFEKTPAAVHAPVVSAEDIKFYINANLSRLERFVERELRYRQANGFLQPNLVSREEVVDEAIATALGDEEERPELLSLERWLYRLAILAVNRLTSGNGEAVTAVPLETSARKQNVRGSDEPQLQYHQPDEMLLQSDVIADRRMATPEDVAASDEMIDIVNGALKGGQREEREAFILYAFEGFTVREIAAISERKEDQVRAAIEAARHRLQKTLPVSHWRDMLLQHSRIA
jgi:DNA-directed RNA polymerase specialized sigma24 family protein/ribosome-associated translation inhibitor RaiA